MFNVTSPEHVNTHPADRTNDSGTWLQPLGNGNFIVLLRDWDVYAFETVSFNIDQDGSYTFGSMVSHDPESTMYYNFQTVFEPFYGKLLVFLAVVDIIVIDIDGLSSSISLKNTLTLSSGPDNGSRTAGAIYLPSEQSILLLVKTLASETAVQVIKLNANDTITEYAVGDYIVSPAYDPAFPTRIVGSAVGNAGDVVYCIRIQDWDLEETRMIFARVTVSGGTTVVNTNLLSSEIDGEPFSLTGDPNSNKFVCRYNDAATSNVKFVCGELDGAGSLIFGLPHEYDGGVNGWGWDTGASIWLKGTDSFVSVLPRSGTLDIVTSYVDNLEITPDLVTRVNIIANSKASGCAVFDVSLNRAVLGVFGDGNGASAVPLDDKPYVFTAEGDPASIALFWHNHTKQKEPVASKLVKQITNTVIPGKDGQPKIPAKPGHPAYCTAINGAEKVCKKVF